MSPIGSLTSRVPGSHNTIDVVAPMVEKALHAAALQEGLIGELDSMTWLSGISLVPGPQGPQAMAWITLTIPNPLIGQPDIGGMSMLPSPIVLRDQDMCNQVVSEIMRQMVETRSAMLSLG